MVRHFAGGDKPLPYIKTSKVDKLVKSRVPMAKKKVPPNLKIVEALKS
jgi:hypothetical protein